MKKVSKSPEETKIIAQRLAEEVLLKKRKGALIIALVGELGSGKTIFSQGFASFLGLKEITSPTFLIFRKYELNKGKYSNFYHMDFYRIEKEEDVKKLGFDEIIKDERNIVLIEWADKVRQLPGAIYLNFEIKGLNKREIERVDNS